MGLPSYMRPVADRNVVMRRIAVLCCVCYHSIDIYSTRSLHTKPLHDARYTGSNSDMHNN
jgi:hypothetical protein